MNDYRTNEEKRICRLKRIGVWLGTLIVYFLISGLFYMANFRPGFLIMLALFYGAKKINAGIEDNSMLEAESRYKREKSKKENNKSQNQGEPEINNTSVKTTE